MFYRAKKNKIRKNILAHLMANNIKRDAREAKKGLKSQNDRKNYLTQKAHKMGKLKN